MKRIKIKIDEHFNQSMRATKAVYKMLNHSAKNHRLRARFYSNHILHRYSMHINPRCKIDKGLIMPHPVGIVMGKGVVIGKNVEILQHVTLGQKNEQFPIIENNVTIYPGAVIVGGITIGHHSVIAPNSVVITDVEPYSIYSGNPAKIIKKIK